MMEEFVIHLAANLFDIELIRSKLKQVTVSTVNPKEHKHHLHNREHDRIKTDDHADPAGCFSTSSFCLYWRSELFHHPSTEMMVSHDDNNYVVEKDKPVTASKTDSCTTEDTTIFRDIRFEFGYSNVDDNQMKNKNNNTSNSNISCTNISTSLARMRLGMLVMRRITPNVTADIASRCSTTPSTTSHNQTKYMYIVSNDPVSLNELKIHFSNVSIDWDNTPLFLLAKIMSVALAFQPSKELSTTTSISSNAKNLFIPLYYTEVDQFSNLLLNRFTASCIDTNVFTMLVYNCYNGDKNMNNNNNNTKESNREQQEKQKEQLDLLWNEYIQWKTSYLDNECQKKVQQQVRSTISAPQLDVVVAFPKETMVSTGNAAASELATEKVTHSLPCLASHSSGNSDDAVVNHTITVPTPPKKSPTTDPQQVDNSQSPGNEVRIATEQKKYQQQSTTKQHSTKTTIVHHGFSKIARKRNSTSNHSGIKGGGKKLQYNG